MPQPTIGLVQWFAFEKYEEVGLAVKTIRDLKVKELRTVFSWADWCRPKGREWFEYFIPQLHKAGVRLLPCLFYTPLEKAREKPGSGPKTSFAPKRLLDFTDFAKEMVGEFGYAFDWIQLWNEPNWQVYWDQDLDPDGKLFAEMIEPAIAACHDAGKKVVLGGLTPYKPEWVEKMFEYGVMQKAEGLGIHESPGSWERRQGDPPWRGWDSEISNARQQLRRHSSNAELWITETGYSTWGEGQKQERLVQQVDYFKEIHNLPVDRIYWYCILDQQTDTPTDDALNLQVEPNKVAYHFGLSDSRGDPKPLYYYWQEQANNPRNQ